jgi:hypothetical protein
MLKETVVKRGSFDNAFVVEHDDSAGDRLLKESILRIAHFHRKSFSKQIFVPE